MSSVSKLVKRMARGFGVEIRRIDPDAVSKDGEYDLILPVATYSPWNKDEEFRQIYRAIQPFTLVDEYRCYDLWKLVEQSAKLPSGELIEIGVWRGGTGALIARQAQRCGLQAKVFLCDTFSGVVKAGTRDSQYKGGEHKDTSREIVTGLVDRLNLDNVRVLQGIFPDETGSSVEQLRFRFCHIDVDVYQSAKEILEWIWGRLLSGGIVVYDDYGFKCCDGITRHVEEQVPAKDRIVLHNLNGHGIIIKL